MTEDELLKRAGTEKDGEELLGQLWIERKRVLGAVNRRPPQLREREVVRQLNRLRRRIAREGTSQGTATVQTLDPGVLDRVRSYITRF